MNNEGFYTFSGYIKKENNYLTASMEDYIEMIYRLSLNKGFTRVNELSQILNVQPPSTTKMIKKLSALNLANYEKYGVITLTDLGNNIGEFLLDRHNLISKFLEFLGVSNNLLEQTEQIEHVVDEETLKCISKFVRFIDENSEIKNKYSEFNNI